jgi:hypothetical protein
MLASAPHAFVFDLHYTATRLSSIPLRQQLWNINYNYTVLLSDGFWIFGGMMGMFVLLPRRLGVLSALLFLLPIFLIGRIVPLYNLSFYYLIPVLPLAALGMAGFVFRAVPWVVGAVQQSLSAGKIRLALRVKSGLSYGLTLFIVGAPLVMTAALDRQQVQDHWPTAIDSFLISPADADIVTDYLNTHIRPGDVVIASAPIAWQMETPTVDFVMSAATIQGDSIHWGNNQSLPQQRFLSNPLYTHARFVVVDNLWQTWGLSNAPDTTTVLAAMAKWPLVFQSGSIRVYENPD